MIEVLKPFYTTLLMPAARIFTKAKISPNAITLVGLCLSGIAGLFCRDRKMAGYSGFYCPGIVYGWAGRISCQAV